MIGRLLLVWRLAVKDFATDLARPSSCSLRSPPVQRR